MDYKILGKSSLTISRIGFGCMSLKPGQAGIQNLIDQAIAAGINYFDTADLYDKGLNKSMIGKALGAKRSQVIIATKVGNQWRSDGSGWDWNPTKRYILQAVEKSLMRLQTDYIDLYQLHGGTINDPIDETIEAFELLQKQGKIRFYGISSIRPNVIREFVKRSNIVSVMMQYNILDRRPEETCFSMLQQNDIGVLARGAVASGLLVNKPAKNYLDFSDAEVLAASNLVKSVAGETAAAQTSIRYVLSKQAVTSAVVGMRNLHQLNEAIESITKQLEVKDVERLENLIESKTYIEHR